MYILVYRSRTDPITARVPEEVYEYMLQGNCNDPPPDELVKHITGTELLPLKPGQCLLTTDASLMNVEHGNMWLDGVYVRQKHTDSYYQSLISVGRKGTLWMTSVTLQGDGSHVPNCEQCALDVASQLYAEGENQHPHHLLVALARLAESVPEIIWLIVCRLRVCKL